ncbi:MAG: efflux RND transporter periplasmic adaptor subunit, partial [Sphingomonadales bacterium]
MNYEAKMFGRQERLEYSGEEGTRRNRRWIWITLGVIVIAGVLAFFLMGRTDGTEKAAAGKGAGEKGGQSQLPTITVISPGRSTVETIVTGTGSLAARREMPVGVA